MKRAVLLPFGVALYHLQPVADCFVQEAETGIARKSLSPNVEST